MGALELPIADRWFDADEIEPGVVSIVEPHVHAWMRSNTWLVRGRDADLLVDTGNGVAPLAPVVEELRGGSDRPLLAVATHGHSDHIGGLHEFEPDKCIICNLCAKACPVDCIKIVGEGTGKNQVLLTYEIDYAKCLFCSLCVDPCPVDCIHMGQQYDLSTFERAEATKVDFTKGEGLWRTAKTSAAPGAGLRREE